METVRVALVVVLAVAMAVATLGPASAQPPCTIFVNPCQAFLNGSVAEPGLDCCNQVESVMKNQFPCMCHLYVDDTVFHHMNVNPVKARELPGMCWYKFDLSACTNAPPQSPGSVAAPPSNPPAYTTSEPVHVPGSEHYPWVQTIKLLAPPSGSPLPENPPLDMPFKPDTPGSVSPPSMPPASHGDAAITRVAMEALAISSFLFWICVAAA